jgi:hypothetical protein
MSTIPKKQAGTTVVAKKATKQGNLFSFFSKKEKTATRNVEVEQATLSAQPRLHDIASKSTTGSTNPCSQKEKPSNLTHSDKSPASSGAFNEVRVGDTIEVYWVDDDKWYQATVTKQKLSTSMFYIHYNIDGEREWIDLSIESFRTIAVDAAESKSSRKRNILSDDTDRGSGDEKEFDDEADSAFVDSGREDEDEDDQWMVTDDDEDEILPKKKQKMNSKAGAVTTFSNSQISSKVVEKRSSTSNISALQQFVAPITLTQQSLGKSTPSNSQHARKTTTTPQHITPMISIHSDLSSRSTTGACVNSIDKSCSSNVSTPLAATKSSESKASCATSRPPSFEVGVLNPAGSHLHNHLPFLQNPRDSHGRTIDDPKYDSRTLKICEQDWIRLNGKKMTDAVKQWWDLKAMYFDTVLLFKTGTWRICSFYLQTSHRF